MNKIEQIKTDKNGLDVGADIPRFAAEGWEVIDEGDAEMADLAGVGAGVHVEAAVDQKQVGVVAASVDRGVDGEADRDVESVCIEDGRSGDQSRKLHVVASVQGQILDLLPVDDPRDLPRDRVDSFAGRPHLERLRDPAHLEAEIHGEAPIGDEHIAGLGDLPESVQFRGHGIGAEGQVHEHVGTPRVGGRGPREVLSGLGNRDAHTGQDTARAVGNRARNAAGVGLRLHPHGAQRQHRDQEGKPSEPASHHL